MKDKKIYLVWDKIAEDYEEAIIIAQNEKIAIRNNLQWIASRYPLKDVELHEFKIRSWKILKEACKKEHKLIDWSEYRYPEDKAEALEPLKAKEMIDKIEKGE